MTPGGDRWSATTFFAEVRRDDDRWIGWVEGLAGVNSQGTSRADLLDHLDEALGEFLELKLGRSGPYRLLAPIWFADLDAKRRALGKLAGRFPFQSRKDGPIFVPGSALFYLSVEGVAFVVAEPDSRLDVV